VLNIIGLIAVPFIAICYGNDVNTITQPLLNNKDYFGVTKTDLP
jgi:hypothetical protein